MLQTEAALLHVQGLLDLCLKTSGGCATAAKHLTAALSALDIMVAAPVPSAEQVAGVVGSPEGLNRHLLGPAPPRNIKVRPGSKLTPLQLRPTHPVNQCHSLLTACPHIS